MTARGLPGFFLASVGSTFPGSLATGSLVAVFATSFAVTVFECGTMGMSVDNG